MTRVRRVRRVRRVMVVNPGSSTLKLSLVVDGEGYEAETVAADALDEIVTVARRWQPLDAVGVRYVHGGHDHLEPVELDDAVLAELDAVAALAPLHNPTASAAARAVREALPDVRVIACFDTAFHATMRPEAYTYALPQEWNEQWRLRRYGFHGLSHSYAAAKGADLAGEPLLGTRIVTCHLGGGASLAAIVDGRSVDTTMGMTPLAGLVMQVRSGSVDPGLVLWLLQHGGLSVDEVADALEHHAGLAGLTGTSGDFREVLAGAEEGDRDCKLALEVYLHRLVREIGAMVASAGGLDLLVFTGGVGENVPMVRDTVVARLGYLAPFETVVVEAREDLAIYQAIVAMI